MPAAVWRTSPARSISLWLTIWASDGLSLRTGRKAWDQRMAPRPRGRACALAMPRPRGHCGAIATVPVRNCNLFQFTGDLAEAGRHRSARTGRRALGSLVRVLAERLGTLAGQSSKGADEQSSRRAPGSQSIRAFRVVRLVGARRLDLVPALQQGQRGDLSAAAVEAQLGPDPRTSNSVRLTAFNGRGCWSRSLTVSLSPSRAMTNGPILES